jgi:hypothetical protein
MKARALITSIAALFLATGTAHAQRQDPAWYAGGSNQLVPAVGLDEGHAVVCPFCPEGVHIHGDDGHHNPGCNGPRAQYLVRGLAPAAYVRARSAKPPMKGPSTLHASGDDEVAPNRRLRATVTGGYSYPTRSADRGRCSFTFRLIGKIQIDS